jgi:hydroxymethylglutaryl-CoA reductase
MSENVIGTFELPLSLAANFIVDHIPVLIPMVTEEPSIVAACSKMAKLASKTQGFTTNIDPSRIKGQIQIYGLRDIDKAVTIFQENKEEILLAANSYCSSMRARGGGVIDVAIRAIPSEKIGPMLIIEPVVDVIDAMGANVVNTMLEKLSTILAPMFDGIIGVKILSNLCDQRMARATTTLSYAELSTNESHNEGGLIASRMIAAHALAEADVYRACTHNKGILNGIDAVAIATGNDFRAIEAGAHAYACANGRYSPLTTLTKNDSSQTLTACLSMPLAVGVVGGGIDRHPGVRLAHKILGPFAKNSRALSSVMVSVGLSQCLAALLALCQEGIQRGHMKLHERKFERQSQTF